MVIFVGINTLPKATIVKKLQQQIPMGSPEPEDSMTLGLLESLTKDLIQSYLNDGLLQENPYQESLNRSINLNKSEIKKQIEGKVILVTGGEGCVGSYLIEQLSTLGVKRIISVDNARLKLVSNLHTSYDQNSLIVFYVVDITNFETLQQVFEAEKPDIVFHLAAQRQPGLAEIQIRQTISTNVFGTKNVIELCERYSIQQCIFSSTGKASRYFTSDVYAGSKKMAEWQFAEAAQKSKVKYGMVRFTHIIENSIVSNKIDQGIQHGIVKLHSPNSYLFAQNNSEATNLLLKALVYSKPNRLNFLVVRNLGWVVDILELALFKISKSGKNISMYFEGSAPGYTEPCFPGQLDPKRQIDANPLINVIESFSSILSSCGDVIVSDMPPFCVSKLNVSLSALRLCTDDLDCPEHELKKIMAKGVKDVACSIFNKTAPEKILRILKLGINPKVVKKEEKDSVEAHKDVIEMLVQSLYGRLSKEVFTNAQLNYDKFSKIVEILETITTIDNEVAYLRAICNHLYSAELIDDYNPSNLELISSS
jgi:nucleoside-diphosphate-sugar epimerase